MRHLRRFLVICLAIVFAGTFWTCSTGPDQKGKAAQEGEKQPAARATKEISIRNVTKEEVRYSARALYVQGEPAEKILKVGAIDRYPGGIGLDISFKSGEEMKSYRLKAGMPYSFRYDEKGQFELYDGSHGRPDAVDLAPYVPTPRAVVEKMLEMAGANKGDVIYDLGCGDGRIVVAAAKKYGAHGVGIDLDPQRIAESREYARREGVEELVEFRQEDVTKSDFSDATIVTLYLLTESNELLRPLLERQLKPGARVVSHNYTIPGWEHKQLDSASLKAEDGIEHTIFAYRR